MQSGVCKAREKLCGLHAFPDQASIRPGVPPAPLKHGAAALSAAAATERAAKTARLLLACKDRVRGPPARPHPSRAGIFALTRSEPSTDGGKRLQLSFGALWLPPNFPPGFPGSETQLTQGLPSGTGWAHSQARPAQPGKGC